MIRGAALRRNTPSAGLDSLSYTTEQHRLIPNVDTVLIKLFQIILFCVLQTTHRLPFLGTSGNYSWNKHIRQ
uniref:Uncharacterized protein n=1 Tax=Anguilla anguilla TaxID=7936 RepID=A0A0E9XN07_ANGAN